MVMFVFFGGFHFIQGDRDGGVANTFRCDVITFGYLLDGTKAFPNRLLDCHHLCVHGRRGKRSSSDDARGIFGNWQTPTWSPAPGSARSSGSGGSRPRGFYQRCTPEVYMKWQINKVSLYNNVKSEAETHLMFGVFGLLLADAGWMQIGPDRLLFSSLPTSKKPLPDFLQ